MRDPQTLAHGEPVTLHESEHVVAHGRFAGIAQGNVLVDNGMGVRLVPLGAEYPHVTDTHGRVIGTEPLE